MAIANASSTVRHHLLGPLNFNLKEIESNQHRPALGLHKRQTQPRRQDHQLTTITEIVRSYGGQPAWSR